MINQKVGYLTIMAKISKISSQSIRQFYVCKCDCGKIVERQVSYITKSSTTNRILSCGCKHPNKKLGNQSATWRGCGQVSAGYIDSLKIRAKRKNIEFNITPKYMWELFVKQDQKCAISGVVITLSESRRTDQIMTASIDRIDPTKGYIEGNVQWVHVTINYMKHALTNDEFLDWCKIVVNKNL